VEKTPKRVLIAVGVFGSLVALIGLIVFLAASDRVTLEMAKLMLAALLGMYVGFGFLILVYLLIRKME
jgi:flagellar motor component MotA